MSILTQLNVNNYLDLLQSQFIKSNKKIIDPHNQNFSIRNYASLIENLGQLFQEYCRDTFIRTLEEIDLAYEKSEIRKRDYYIKTRRSRTLVTVFGVITFKRIIYQNRYTNRCFTYLDRKIGLPRWDTYDATIKSMICELYADQNSMIKVGQIIGDRIYAPYSTSLKRHQFNISRQTVHNTLKSTLLTKQRFSLSQETPKELYIMADEKYVPIQKGETAKTMVKSAVIFENITREHKRTRLIGKTIYSSVETCFWEDIYDIVSEKYDIDKIENIHIMGDGANWIKSGTHQFENAQFSLDKFHFKQAVNHISTTPEIKSILISNIVNNQKSVFKEIISALVETTPALSRAKTIEDKSDYILNQWSAIQASFHDTKIGCSMESAISHNLASVFTSRPKAYTKENLRYYISLRNLHLNNVDIRNHYLDTLNEPRNKKHYKEKESFDFSMFEAKSLYDKSSRSNWVKGFISKI